MTSRSVESIRAELLRTFDDYHSSIVVQKRLVAELVDAVRREERERCAEHPLSDVAPIISKLGH